MANIKKKNMNNKLLLCNKEKHHKKPFLPYSIFFNFSVL